MKNLLNAISKLPYVDRSQGIPRICRQNLAEHSLNVTYYSMIMADFYPEVNTEAVMKIAILHDIEETQTGDIPHPIKQNYNHKADIEDIAIQVAEDIFESKEWSQGQYYLELWKRSHNIDKYKLTTDDFALKLVGAADILDFFLWISKEIRFSSTELESTYRYTLDIISDLRKEIYPLDYILKALEL